MKRRHLFSAEWARLSVRRRGQAYDSSCQRRAGESSSPTVRWVHSAENSFHFHMGCESIKKRQISLSAVIIYLSSRIPIHLMIAKSSANQARLNTVALYKNCPPLTRTPFFWPESENAYVNSFIGSQFIKPCFFTQNHPLQITDNLISQYISGNNYNNLVKLSLS